MDFLAPSHQMAFVRVYLNKYSNTVRGTRPVGAAAAAKTVGGGGPLLTHTRGHMWPLSLFVAFCFAKLNEEGKILEITSNLFQPPLPTNTQYTATY